MTANPSPAPIRKGTLSESETRALLADCRRQIRSTIWLLETEEKLRPERMTGHLAEKGRAILGRIDAATLNTEGEAQD